MKEAKPLPRDQIIYRDIPLPLLGVQIILINGYLPDENGAGVSIGGTFEMVFSLHI